MYKIIGGDKKEYGPVDAQQLRRWFTEGRVNGQTLVQGPNSTEWRPLETFPELAPIATEAVPPVAPAMAPATATASTGASLPDNDYDLDIGGCVSTAWDIWKRNFGLLLSGVLVFMLVQLGLGLLGQIPILGLIFTAASIILGGVFMGGLYYFLLRVVRGELADIGDIFAGFRINVGHLILVNLVAALPGLLIAGVGIFMKLKWHETGPVFVVLVVLGGLVALIPTIYLRVCWLYAVPLVIDKGMDFWPALGYSRQMVSKHWWPVFGLLIVTSLINIAGLLLCCIGIFASTPLAFAALACGYERIFNGRTASTTVTP